MEATLLDTDILSEFLKQRNSAVNQRAAGYLQEHGQFTFSAFTRFEVRRGFLERQATQQLERFEEFCRHPLVLPVEDAIFDEACSLWATARQGGHPCGDADLLIAATAKVHKLTLTTGNLQHFDWIPDLMLEDWRSV
jgi:predicted nucleic acid-binding protein